MTSTSICDYPEPVSEQAALTPRNGGSLDLPEGIPPLRAFYLYLSNSCNLACRHCWITPRFVNGEPSPGDVIDVKALAAAVAEAKPLGLWNAKLTGGEPMFHPRFLEIVDLLTAEGLHMNMETNGTLLTAEIARYLKEKTNVTFISISLDGPDAAMHDTFRGKAGAFDGALRGLEHLVNAGYTNTQIIMSVHHGNRAEIENVVHLAAERGAGSVKLCPVTNTGRGAGMRERGEDLYFEERVELARYVNRDLRKRAPVHIAFNMPPALTPLPEIERKGGSTGDCGVRGILGFLGTGEIALCGIGRTIPELVYGKLGKDSIRDIWLNHPTIHALRRALDDVKAFPGVCAKCIHARTCRTGCVAQNFVDGGHLVWPSWLCAEADRRGQFPAPRRRNAVT